MGTKMGPSYANLFVGFIEKQFFDKFDGTKPELYHRYIEGFENVRQLNYMRRLIAPVKRFSNFFRFPSFLFTKGSQSLTKINWLLKFTKFIATSSS